MVHRDPETGQFLSDDDEPVELTYSDHEFLNFRIGARNDEGPAATAGTEYQVESDVLDLENDELGMLTWMNCTLSAHFSGPPEEEETRGGAVVTAEIGGNLADNEYLALADQNSGIQETDTESAVNTYELQANDEPGLWGHLTASAQSAFKDSDSAGDPYSGGASADNDRIRRVFSEETGGGPYIDATDDVSIGLFTRKTETTCPLFTVIEAQMAFAVFEYENRRAEFAPYDPGPHMG